VFLLNKPSDQKIKEILDRHRHASFSYTDIGITRGGLCPERPGFDWDNNRVKLGYGEMAYKKAIEAVRNWKMFEFPWASFCWPDTPIVQGNIVAAVFTHFGFWSANLCRIVYVVDEQGPIDRFGFAYGTLEEHAERGEERFTVEWNHGDNSVWYDILAFSQPRNILARLGYPVSRRLQRKFVYHSKQSMVTTVASPSRP
jgi:uncharacterized protein (UPF0548 family)